MAAAARAGTRFAQDVWARHHAVAHAERRCTGITATSSANPPDLGKIRHRARGGADFIEQLQAIFAHLRVVVVDLDLVEERIDRRAQFCHRAHRAGEIFLRHGGAGFRLHLIDRLRERLFLGEAVERGIRRAVEGCACPSSPRSRGYCWRAWCRRAGSCRRRCRGICRAPRRGGPPSRDRPGLRARTRHRRDRAARPGRGAGLSGGRRRRTGDRMSASNVDAVPAPRASNL